MVKDVAEWIEYNASKVNDIVSLVDDNEKLILIMVRSETKKSENCSSKTKKQLYYCIIALIALQ
ncbi:hypothetical protein [Oxobacter pfennigii]|uniref:hypothetical protein n=1 Tax=Oxobacter pfennigii TaxID=36849 RepID=UPI0006D3B705|nr:hypothetical protein [Oxobacter pfennigii]